MEKILVYGSLRKGCYNYEYFERGMKFIETKTLEGYDMYSLGAYPYVVEGEGAIKVDVMEVDEATKRRIDSMEHGAGYLSKVESVDDHEGTIYVYKRKLEHTPQVEDGDWVNFVQND